MKKILVLVDVQRDFITGSLANENAQNAIPNIVEKINNFDGDCIFVTLDTHNEDYLETKEGIFLPVEHCIEGSIGHMLESTVENALLTKQMAGCEVVMINKPTFGSTTLVEKIGAYVQHETEEFSIELIGFCTDICVISNALLLKASFYDDANISVDASCCAGVTPAKHSAALDVLESCQIIVNNRN